LRVYVTVWFGDFSGAGLATSKLIRPLPTYLGVVVGSLRIGDWVIEPAQTFGPREVVLEVTTRCNLQCVHCFRFAVRGFRYVDMDYGSFRRVVDNAVESGVTRLVFSGWGEPTVNPYVLDMLSYAKSRGLTVVLNTNGVRLAELAEDLVRVGVDELYVSIDAVDVDLYERIRRLGSLSAVSRGLERLFECKRRADSRRPVVKTIFTVTRLNVGNIAKLLDYAVEANILEVYLSLYIPYEGGAAGLSCEDGECLAELRAQLERVAVKAINMPVRVWTPNLSSYTSRRCPFASNKALYVRSDGKVAPCIYMAYTWTTVLREVRRRIREFVIGDALSESLGEVWRRNTLMIFRLHFNYMPSCIDCELVNWCSYTLSSEVNCWGEEPNCSHCPYHYRLSYCPL
jgi:MoaA/NifB/PqqE/SkfB family radical SAM enzyme